MKILALDTATENCSAALFINGALLCREELLGRGHAQHILSMIEELLFEADVALQDLTAIAFGRGPGAFTGVRLAASVTQGLAFGAALPVVAVSDLQALAQRALGEEAQVERVLVCTDARMHEVYCGAFERGSGGLAVALAAEHVAAPDAVRLPSGWPQAPAVTEAKRRLGVGSGFAAYPELRATNASALDSIREDLWPRAAEIAHLARVEVNAGRVLAPEAALPVYLRDDVARPQRPHA
jgi:tRNA threonylcarbamoyladenosine biosynthesis protein TsaB